MKLPNNESLISKEEMEQFTDEQLEIMVDVIEYLLFITRKNKAAAPTGQSEDAATIANTEPETGWQPHDATSSRVLQVSGDKNDKL